MSQRRIKWAPVLFGALALVAGAVGSYGRDAVVEGSFDSGFSSRVEGPDLVLTANLGQHHDVRLELELVTKNAQPSFQATLDDKTVVAVTTRPLATVGYYTVAIDGDPAKRLRGEFEWRSGISIKVSDGGSHAPRLRSWKVWSGKNRDDSSGAAATRRFWRSVLTVVWVLGTVGGLGALVAAALTDPAPAPQPVPLRPDDFLEALIGMAGHAGAQDDRRLNECGKAVLRRVLLNGEDVDTAKAAVTADLAPGDQGLVDAGYLVVRMRLIRLWRTNRPAIDSFLGLADRDAN